MLNCGLFVQSAPSPVPDPNDNSIFQFINEVLKRNVNEQTQNETNLEIGDKIKSDDGNFKLEVLTFKPDTNQFPIIFTPNGGEDLFDDKKLVKTDGGFINDDSGEYTFKDRSNVTEAPTTTKTTTTAKVANITTIVKS